MRHDLAPTDLRAEPTRQTGRGVQLSERRASDPREDVALEVGRVWSPMEALPRPVRGAEGVRMMSRVSLAATVQIRDGLPTPAFPRCG